MPYVGVYFFRGNVARFQMVILFYDKDTDFGMDTFRQYIQKNGNCLTATYFYSMLK